MLQPAPALEEATGAGAEAFLGWAGGAFSLGTQSSNQPRSSSSRRAMSASMLGRRALSLTRSSSVALGDSAFDSSPRSRLRSWRVHVVLVWIHVNTCAHVFLSTRMCVCVYWHVH